MENLNAIKTNPVYKQVLADSFGGVMFNVANRNKYDTSEILQMWDNLTPVERNSVDGIMEGAFNFLSEGQE